MNGMKEKAERNAAVVHHAVSSSTEYNKTDQMSMTKNFTKKLFYPIRW